MTNPGFGHLWRQAVGIDGVDTRPAFFRFTAREWKAAWWRPAKRRSKRPPLRSEPLKKTIMNTQNHAPTGAFIGAAWTALLVGITSY
jgi:hypothetical protein